MKENYRISKERILYELVPGLIIWAVLIFGIYTFYAPEGNAQQDKVASVAKTESKPKPTSDAQPKENPKPKTDTTVTVPKKTVVEIPPKNVAFSNKTKLLYPKEGANVRGKKIDFRWRTKLKNFRYFKVILIYPNKEERTLVTTRKQNFSWTFDEANGKEYNWKVLTISKENGKTETFPSKVSSFSYRLTARKKKFSRRKRIVKRKDHTKIYNKAPIENAIKQSTKSSGSTSEQKTDSKHVKNHDLGGKAAYVSDKK